MIEELPKEDIGSGLPAIPDSGGIPGEPDALATTTSAAAEAVVENPDSAVTRMKGGLALYEHVSQELLNVLEPMPGSTSGVGIRTKDGTLYEVVFIWDNYGRSAPMLYLRQTLRVEGASLNGTFEVEKAFYIAAFSDPSCSIKEEEKRGNPSFECQQALANNPALAGRLSVDGKHEAGIRIVFTGNNDREFVFYLAGGGNVAIFERNSRRSVSGSFDPAAVTLDELFKAIDALAS